MRKVGEIDLSRDPADWVLPDGPSLLLVRDGRRILGEFLLEDPAATTPDALVTICAEAFSERLYASRLITAEPAAAQVAPQDITIVVCTRDRPELLRDCLASLAGLDPRPGEVIVVDNASRSPATAEVVRQAGFRLVREERPGLDHARNRGWREARGTVVAYVDDDARADRRLVQALAAGFLDPTVGLVTGLVLPAELDTRAQLVFERAAGMRKGYDRRLFHRDDEDPVGFSTHVLGVGAIMAMRRDVLEQLGGFDPCLDVGTATAGAGDLEMFHRILEAGCVAVYEPSVVVRHVHRRDLGGWFRQLRGYGLGYAAYLESVAVRCPHLRRRVRRERWRWHLQRHVWGVVNAVRRRRLADLVEVTVEGAYSLGGRRAYRQERARSMLQEPR